MNKLHVIKQYVLPFLIMFVLISTNYFNKVGFFEDWFVAGKDIDVVINTDFRNSQNTNSENLALGETTDWDLESGFVSTNPLIISA
ncbi:MAG TPA: hypothetical protein VE912_14270, partial [Bacteroidales bacterium]|nr:hypothetical protein [Bacteroidales bacterium]